jgi:hypothetical protein
MSQQTPHSDAEGFSRQAARKRTGATRELVDFLRHNKKWWLAPIVVMLLVVGGLVILAGTSAAPFIYTLF